MKNQLEYAFHRPTRRKEVAVLDKNNKQVAVFGSISECAKKINMNRSYCSVLLKKGKRTNLGYGIIEING